MEPPDLDNMSAADLRDDERLAALYREAVRRIFWPASARAVLDLWCLAEKVLAEKLSPTGRGRRIPARNAGERA